MFSTLALNNSSDMMSWYLCTSVLSLSVSSVRIICNLSAFFYLLASSCVALSLDAANGAHRGLWADTSSLFG